jgi:hypothetical protein
MNITLQIQPEIASALRRGDGRSRATTELLDAASELGIKITPIHPDTPDTELSTYFTTDAPDRETARDTIKRLRSCRGVTAAYIKPAASVP